MINDLVTIVLINVQDNADTIECIKSIYASESLPFQIIVIENSKNEKYYNRLKEFLLFALPDFLIKKNLTPPNNPVLEFEREDFDNMHFSGTNHLSTEFSVAIIKNQRVSGFSENTNLALKLIINQNISKYIWLLNNDTIINTDSIGKLKAEMLQDHKNGLVGSVLVYMDRTDTIQCIGGGSYLSFPVYGVKSFKKNTFLKELNNIPKKDILNKINMISGASFFFKTEIIHKIGFWDEDFFLFLEDADYSRRIRDAGYLITVCMENIVLHKHNASTKKISKSFYYYHSGYACVIYLKKYYNAFHLPFGVFSTMMHSLISTRNIKYATASLLGSIDSIRKT